MAKTVSSLIVEMALDSRKFREQNNLTVREFRNLQRELKKSQTPVEKLETEIKVFKQTATEATKSTEAYKQALAGMEKRLDTAKKKQAEMNVVQAKAVEIVDAQLAPSRRRRLGGLLGSANRGLGLSGINIPGVAIGEGAAGLGAAGVAGLSVGAGIAGTAAVSKLVTDLTIKHSEYAVSLADTSDKIGLSAAALRGIQEQAALTGVSAETTSMALQRMRRRIAEASVGAGEAQGALRELRLDAKKLASVDADKQFLAIAKAMKEVESSGDRLRLAFKLFDSEGASLVNTLMTSQDELEKASRAWEDVLEPEDIVRYRELSASLELTRGSLTRLGLMLSERFAPVLTDMLRLTDRLSDNTSSLGMAFDVAASASSMLVSGLDALAVAVDRVLGPLEAAGGWFFDIGRRLGVVADQQDRPSNDTRTPSVGFGDMPFINSESAAEERARDRRFNARLSRASGAEANPVFGLLGPVVPTWTRRFPTRVRPLSQSASTGTH